MSELIEVAVCDCDNLFWLSFEPGGNGHACDCAVPVVQAMATIERRPE